MSSSCTSCVADNQCRDITQYLTRSVRDLGIGTYIAPAEQNPLQAEDQGYNPYYPLATATLQTTAFDVVHMFSEKGISAVPIVDDAGKVINLYETVDVIVRPIGNQLCASEDPEWSVS